MNVKKKKRELYKNMHIIGVNILYSSFMNIIFSGSTMKKSTIIFNLLGVFLCGLTTPAAADFCGQNCNNCCEWSVLDGKMTVGADWLYWKVQQDGILPARIATEGTEIINDLVIPFSSSRGIHSDPKWNSGFRVSLGYELPCDCWDVNLCYTYMPSRDKLADFTVGEDERIFAFAPGGVYDFFASKWNLTLNNIDLDIGRTVCFGECLTLRPHVGFRATWFDQTYRGFGSFQGIESDIANERFDSLTIKQKFQGYGVEAGLWANYKLSCGVSLVGHFGGSILYSKFNVRRNGVSGIFQSVEDTLLTEASHDTDSFFTATPSLDYFVGLQYADTMCDMLYKVHLGWEQHVLFDTNRFLSSGNLSGQGLTLGLEVGF